jgi:hypothetical protein
MNKYSCIFYNFKDDLIHENNNEDENKNEKNKKNKKNKKYKKYNYKFVSKDFFIENELFISNLISQMINHKKYFYIPSKIEKINFVNIDNENINDFETEYDINLKYRKKIKSNNILLKYDNIPILNFKIYLSFEKKYFFYKIINIYTQLLKSINMLNEKNIFFNNLNDENIFINQFDSPILTDFSFSIHFNSIKENLNNFILAYDPSYIQWPIEIHAIAYLFHHKLNSLSRSNIDTIVTDLINNNFIFENFNDTIKQKYYDNGISFLSKFINKRKDELISNIILYFKSWDNYALSILYLQIIIKIYKSIKNKNNKFIIEFMKLLLKNISFNPEQRFSLKNTKLHFNNILNNITKSEYKEIIEEALCYSHD